jgi:hypothetical protein
VFIRAGTLCLLTARSSDGPVTCVMFTILVTVCHLPKFFDCVFIVVGDADIILYCSGCLSRVFHVRSTW